MKKRYYSETPTAESIIEFIKINHKESINSILKKEKKENPDLNINIDDYANFIFK